MVFASMDDSTTGTMAGDMDDYIPRTPGGGATRRFQNRSTVQYNASNELQSTILNRATPHKYVPYSGTGGMGGFDPEYFAHPTATRYTYRYASVQDKLMQFDSFSHKEFLRLRNMMAAAGFVSEDAAPVETRTAYGAMLVNMAKEGIQLTPEDYLKNLIRMSGKNPNKLGGGGRKRWKQVNTQRTIYELDHTDAKIMMTNAMQEYLGRDPTPEEVADFKNAINTEAEEDPNIVRATTKYRKGGDVSTTTRRTIDPGFTQNDALDAATEEAKDSPDYASYQAVSTYFPVVESLLNASVAI